MTWKEIYKTGMHLWGCYDSRTLKLWKKILSQQTRELHHKPTFQIGKVFHACDTHINMAAEPQQEYAIWLLISLQLRKFHKNNTNKERSQSTYTYLRMLGKWWTMVAHRHGNLHPNAVDLATCTPKATFRLVKFITSTRELVSKALTWGLAPQRPLSDWSSFFVCSALHPKLSTWRLAPQRPLSNWSSFWWM